MKKTKIFKKITLAGLAACMFCLPILAGCAPAEMLPQNPGPGQNFDLGLNPETDPIVFTTESGLEIKKSDAKYGSTTILTSNEGLSTTQNLTSFYYFTMGTFSGTIYTVVDGSTTANYVVTNDPVNWLIIGRGEMPVADNSPAGSAIQGDAGKQEIAMGSSIYENLNLSAIPKNSEIPKGCFLVLSEKLLGQMHFNSSGAVNGGSYLGSTTCYRITCNGGTYGNCYRYYGDIKTPQNDAHNQSWNNKTNGILFNYINNLFSKNNSTGAIEGSNNLGFTPAQADMIVPQQLYTYYSNGTGYNYQETPSTDGGTYYTMFPLALSSAHSSTYQNFCVEDYLTTNAQRTASLIGSNQSYFWWLRSGSSPNSAASSVVVNTGDLGSYNHVFYSHGVRPAMVMRLQ